MVKEVGYAEKVVFEASSDETRGEDDGVDDTSNVFDCRGLGLVKVFVSMTAEGEWTELRSGNDDDDEESGYGSPPKEVYTIAEDCSEDEDDMSSALELAYLACGAAKSQKRSLLSSPMVTHLVGRRRPRTGLQASREALRSGP